MKVGGNFPVALSYTSSNNKQPSVSSGKNQRLPEIAIDGTHALPKIMQVRMVLDNDVRAPVFSDCSIVRTYLVCIRDSVLRAHFETRSGRLK